MNVSPTARAGAGARRRRWPLPVLLLVTALLLLAGIDRVPVSREQELRVALTARDMAQGGSWLYPHYQGKLRLKKPPLLYWTVAAACQLAGTVNAPLVTRLPTAAAGVGLVWLIAAGGARFVGRRRALAAALVCATSFVFLRYARLGETDLPLAFFTTLSILLAYRALRAGRGAALWLAAGAAAGVGFLIKGPAALALPVAAVAAGLALAPGLRGRGAWAGLAALPVFALVALPWYLLVLHAPGAGAEAGAAVDSELHALSDRTAHLGSVFYYLYTLCYALAPWGLLWPVAAWDLWRRHARGGARAAPRFLLGWFLSSVLVLSLVPSKQLHYVALLLAPASLLFGSFLAAGLRAAARTWRARTVRGYLGFLFALFGVGALALLFVGPAQPGLSPGGALAVTAVLAALSAFGLRSLRAPGLRPALVLAALVAVAQTAYVFVFLPSVDPRTAYARFAAEAAPRLPAAGRLMLVGTAGGTLEYYLGREMLPMPDAASAWAEARPGDAVVVSTSRRAGAFCGVPPVPPALEIRNRDVRVALFVR